MANGWLIRPKCRPPSPDALPKSGMDAVRCSMPASPKPLTVVNPCRRPFPNRISHLRRLPLRRKICRVFTWNDTLARMDEWEGNIRIRQHHISRRPAAARIRSTERWRAGSRYRRMGECRSASRDIIETADMPTEQGSPLFKGWHSVRGRRRSRRVPRRLAR